MAPRPSHENEPVNPARSSPATGEERDEPAQGDDEPGVFVPRTVYWVLTVLALLFMGLILLTSSTTRKNPDKLSQPTEADSAWMADALFSENSRDVVYGWPCSPLTIIINEETSRSVMRKIKKTVTEITRITDVQLLTQTENDWVIESAPCSKIFLGVSPSGLMGFERFYSDIFRKTYGDGAYEHWAEQGAFEFTYSAQHPCFGFGVYETQDFLTDGYIHRNPPDIFMIGVGDALFLGSKLLNHCLREELAHVAFFIPDRPVTQSDESIFNANPMEDAIDEFSLRDRQLMRFIASNSQIVGMDREALADEVTDWIKRIQIRP